MKVKVVAVMKRWWLTVLILTLAFSLTSCSRTYPYDSGYVLGYCDGTIGNFDVYLFPNSGAIRVVIVPYALRANGDIATIAVGATSGAYKILSDQVTLMQNQEILAGSLTPGEYASFPILAITTYVAGNYSTAQSPYATRCQLPALQNYY